MMFAATAVAATWISRALVENLAVAEGHRPVETELQHSRQTSRLMGVRVGGIQRQATRNCLGIPARVKFTAAAR